MPAMMTPVQIRPLTLSDLPSYEAHAKRHRNESGHGDLHFWPFEANDVTGPKGLSADALTRPLTDIGWQRCFVALSKDESSIVGDVNLKGDGLRTGLHRCELGIGIERPYRKQGLGRRLMATAIEFAAGAKSLGWIDLKVFAHNTPARSLYRELGFVEIAVVRDRFRIGGQSIDDVIMTLDLSARSAR